MKRVRIVNDGKPGYFTKITDAQTGESIECVTNIEISLGMDGHVKGHSYHDRSTHRHNARR